MSTDPETLRRAVLDLYERVERLEMRADGLSPIERVQRRWAKESAGGDKLDRLIAQDKEADGPAVPEGREPAAVMDELSDEELLEDGPSLEQVEELCEDHCFNVEGYESIECLQGLINDALARWGRWIEPSSKWQPIETAPKDGTDTSGGGQDDGPAVPEGREPASVMQHPTDAELLELMHKSMRDDLAEVSRLAALQAGTEPGVFRICLNYDVVQFARAVLARWVPPGWQPIETAPQDGTEILASDYDAVEILSWEPPRRPGSRGCWISRNLDPMFPAWWQPLPDHPPLTEPTDD